MKNNSVSNLLCAIFLLSACSKHEKTNIIREVEKKSNQNLVEVPLVSSTFKDWQDLLLSKKVSIQTLEILSSEVVSQDRTIIKNMMSDLTENELKEIEEEIRETELSTRNHYLFRGAEWSKHQKFLDQTLLGDGKEAFKNSKNLSNSIIISVAAKARKNFLNEVLVTYSKRMDTLSSDIASSILTEAQKNSPGELAKILKAIKTSSEQEAIEYLKDFIEGHKNYIEFYESSGLNVQEKATLVVSGVIAYKIYQEVKNTQSFEKFLKAVESIQQLHKKYKELVILSNSIQGYTKKMHSDAEKFVAASKDIQLRLSTTLTNLSKKDFKTDINTKKILNHVYDQVVGDTKNKLNPKASPHELTASVNQMISSTARMAGNFSAILNTTLTLSDSLGVKLSPEIIKLADKVQKVSAVVNIASSLITGFSKGGALGAMASLTGSSALSQNGFETQAMARFDGIDKKLDEVVKLQKQMIDLQLQTMTMIKNVAHMIDQYHQEEMDALNAIKNRNVVILELSKMSLHSGIRSCENLIAKYIHDQKNLYKLSGRGSEPSIAEFSSQELFEKLKTFTNVKEFVRSTRDSIFSDCQGGISAAFEMENMEENPIFSIYSSTEKNDLKSFYEEKYLPLYGLVGPILKTGTGFSNALHAPVESIKSINNKINLIKGNLENTHSIEGEYELKSYISFFALQRYATQLLALHPYLELDHDEWNESIDNVFKSYRHATTKQNFSPRGVYFLENALLKTQSAIAQEALLAGEPIMNLVFSSLEKYFNTETPCDGNSPEACAIRSNPILVRNLILYSFSEAKNSFGYTTADYNKAFEGKDIKTLEKLIFDNRISNRIVLIGDSLKFILYSKNGDVFRIDLPNTIEIHDNKVTYSDDMRSLLSLQDKILDALVKVTPLNIDHNLEKVGMLILSKELEETK